VSLHKHLERRVTAVVRFHDDHSFECMDMASLS